MESATDIPFCPLPPETTSDMVPMGIVLGLFLLGGWFFRRRQRKKRGGGKRR